jgi:hypothetical protein
MKAATLHRSDFVQQNAANTKTNKKKNKTKKKKEKKKACIEKSNNI